MNSQRNTENKRGYSCERFICVIEQGKEDKFHSFHTYYICKLYMQTIYANYIHMHIENCGTIMELKLIQRIHLKVISVKFS